MYAAFTWWWSENQDVHEKRMPAMKTVNKSLRERGFLFDSRGGKTWILSVSINLDVTLEVDTHAAKFS
jgi:hypothetical protein